jgi:hypothetical protein
MANARTSYFALGPVVFYGPDNAPIDQCRRRAAQAERTETPSDKALQELLGYQLTPLS